MIKQLSDATTAGNANADFVVPAKKLYRVLYGQVSYTADATVANRRIKLQVVDDSSNVIFDVHSGDVVTASEASFHHEFMGGVYRETSFIGDALQVPMPADFVVMAGHTLRVDIDAGVAGDSYVTYFIVDELTDAQRTY